MANNATNTYQQAKHIFETLGLKEDVTLDVPIENVSIFRKHLSEMIKRKKSSNKYATRALENTVKIIRIQ